MPLTIDFETHDAASVTADINFAANGPESGKYARAFDPGGFIADIKRWRPPGTDGYLITRSGALGRKITVTVRYIDTLEALATQIQIDTENLAKEAWDITCMGNNYYGCNLVPGSVVQVTRYMATGLVAGQALTDITMMFTEDQPEVTP